MPSDLTLEKLRASVAAFRDERDWAQFHSPKNLAMALSVEAGELVEIYLSAPENREPEICEVRRPPLDGRLAVPPRVPLAAEPPAPAVLRLPRRRRRALVRPQRPALPRAPRPPRRRLAARGKSALGRPAQSAEIEGQSMRFP